LAMCLFLMTFRTFIKKLLVPTKRANISLIKVKSCNAFLRMLLVYVCILSYLKSVKIYKFLILDTYLLYTLIFT